MQDATSPRRGRPSIEARLRCFGYYEGRPVDTPRGQSQRTVTCFYVLHREQMTLDTSVFLQTPLGGRQKRTQQRGSGDGTTMEESYEDKAQRGGSGQCSAPHYISSHKHHKIMMPLLCIARQAHERNEKSGGRISNQYFATRSSTEAAMQSHYAAGTSPTLDEGRTATGQTNHGSRQMKRVVEVR